MTVEVAVVFPMVIVVVLLAVQTAVGFHARQLVSAAAQDGLRAAQASTGTPVSGRDAAEDLLAAETSGFLIDPDVTVTETPGTVTVTASGTVQSVVPFLDWDITVTETGPTEMFRPGGGTP